MKATREQQAALNRMWKVNKEAKYPQFSETGFKSWDKVVYVGSYYYVAYSEGFDSIPIHEESNSIVDDNLGFFLNQARSWTELFPSKNDPDGNWKTMMDSKWVEGFKYKEGQLRPRGQKYRSYELQTMDNEVFGIQVNPKYIRDILILLKAHKADDFTGVRCLVDTENWRRGVCFVVTHGSEVSHGVLLPINSHDVPFTPRKKP